MDYWYVRARHAETGREVQRIAAPGDAGDGLATATMAADAMKAFLVATGWAMDADAWEIVEVHRFDEWASAHGPGVMPRRLY